MLTITKLYEICNFLDELAPSRLAEKWDNPGLLIESPEQNIRKAMLALDCTNEVVHDAIDKNCQLIITHHPIIFHPLRTIQQNSLVSNLIRNNISVFSAHTNLDLATGGVNDVLCEILDLNQTFGLEESLDEHFLGKIGKTKRPYGKIEFIHFVKNALACPFVRANQVRRKINTVAVCGGSGGNLLEIAHSHNADCLVTADVKHDQFINANFRNLLLIDAGHFYTENVIINSLQKKLSNKFPNIEFEISNFNVSPLDFY